MLRNDDYGIKTITMYPEAICYCPLGSDWYSNKFEVIMKVKEVIPDYCEVEEWLDKNIRGQSLVIEEALKKFRDYLNETYDPSALDIASLVEDAKHFAVRVEA